MATSDLKRFIVPGALVIGGVTVGSMLAPIGFAAAQDDDTDSDGTDSVEESESVTDGDEEESDWRGRIGRRSGVRGHGPGLDVLTETLGLEADELRDALQDGKSLADIATEQGVSVDELKAALQQAAEERIDQALADGHIDEEKAAELKATLAEHVEAHINRSPTEGRRGHGHRSGGKLGLGSEAAEQHRAALAEFLGLTTEDLQVAFENGQSLAETAQAQGISEDELVAYLLQGLEERLDDAVENGKLDADHVADILENAEARIEQRVNAEPGERGERRGQRMRDFGRGFRNGHRFGHSHDHDADGTTAESGSVAETGWEA